MHSPIDIAHKAVDAIRVGLVDQLVDHYRETVHMERLVTMHDFNRTAAVRIMASRAKRDLSVIIVDPSHCPADVEAKAVEMVALTAEHASLQLERAVEVLAAG